MGDASKDLNSSGTTCKSIPNTKTLEAKVGDGTYFHIACIVLHYGYMGDASRDLNMGKTIVNRFQTPKLQRPKLVMGLTFILLVSSYTTRVWVMLPEI